MDKALSQGGLTEHVSNNVTSWNHQGWSAPRTQMRDSGLTAIPSPFLERDVLHYSDPLVLDFDIVLLTVDSPRSEFDS